MITIIQTRYHGVYEGGLWAAFYCSPWEIPEETWQGDTFASRWWLEHEREAGVGETPDEALEDLRRKRHH